MRTLALVTAALGLAGLMIGCSSNEGGAEDAESSASAADYASRDLAPVRAATAKYHDVNVALADGYQPGGPCTAVPGLGGMGIHFINFDRAFAPINANEPTVVLFEPTNDGLKLVAVEYVQFIFQDGRPYTDSAPPRPESIPPAPQLFGQTFDGPMPGHFPGMPWHFDFHVWIWKHNPNGMFTDFNPNVKCP